jgi:hypothetical protein
MNKNTVLRHLVEKKYNVLESHIVRLDNTFTITADNGKVFTEQDFTDDEIIQMETELAAKIVETETQAAAKKQLAENKLNALGLTAEDLKALGL